MNEQILVILVWAILAGVLVAYVTYRFVTDRRTDEKRHFLYPLVSNPTDGMFPYRRNIVGWIAYILLLIGMVGFITVIFITY